MPNLRLPFKLYCVFQTEAEFDEWWKENRKSWKLAYNYRTRDAAEDNKKFFRCSKVNACKHKIQTVSDSIGITKVYTTLNAPLQTSHQHILTSPNNSNQLTSNHTTNDLVMKLFENKGNEKDSNVSREIKSEEMNVAEEFLTSQETLNGMIGEVSGGREEKKSSIPTEIPQTSLPPFQQQKEQLFQQKEQQHQTINKQPIQQPPSTSNSLKCYSCGTQIQSKNFCDFDWRLCCECYLLEQEKSHQIECERCHQTRRQFRNGNCYDCHQFLKDRQRIFGSRRFD